MRKHQGKNATRSESDEAYAQHWDAYVATAHAEVEAYAEGYEAWVAEERERAEREQRPHRSSRKEQ